jgi:hypothetical protein
MEIMPVKEAATLPDLVEAAGGIVDVGEGVCPPGHHAYFIALLDLGMQYRALDAEKGQHPTGNFEQKAETEHTYGDQSYNRVVNIWLTALL